MPDRRDDFAIRRVATLARVRLTADEEVLYAKQLGEILAHASDVLAAVASASPSEPDLTSTRAPLRGDHVRPSADRDEILSQAPASHGADGLFRVPRVMN
jgi:aspartyl-tRNA(Asn)/glutamyl-tRNA(Gln) amidotransferase subunit C